jgi:hypothetical protein
VHPYDLPGPLLTASDAASNGGTTAITIIRDTVIPIVTITSPTAGLTNINTPVLTCAASDANVAVSVDGIVANKLSGNYLDTLSEGVHTVRVESRDAAGNVGLAEVSFIVDTMPPQQTAYSKVSAGTNHTLALKSDGTIWSWGYNVFGQLGDGTTANRYYPVQIGNDSQWITISAGKDFTLALKSDRAGGEIPGRLQFYCHFKLLQLKSGQSLTDTANARRFPSSPAVPACQHIQGTIFQPLKRKRVEHLISP